MVLQVNYRSNYQERSGIAKVKGLSRRGHRLDSTGRCTQCGNYNELNKKLHLTVSAR
jgi:hypothetical protein